jgi:hypothetical protein
MNPSARFGISLVVSLLLWWPTFQSCLHGDTDLMSAAMRYLLAFGFALFAVNGLAQLIIGYASGTSVPPVPDLAPAPVETPAPRRRRDDFSDLAQPDD